uniref:Uncharacterized protein n=1 Tax=Gopherus agassizii TaxID=38772 RepID=A0A452GM31_9SAUR
ARLCPRAPGWERGNAPSAPAARARKLPLSAARGAFWEMQSLAGSGLAPRMRSAQRLLASLVTLGCDVQKNKNRTQLGLRSLTSEGTLGQAKVTSTLTPSHSSSSSRNPRTRHEKKPVALSRKIATRKLGRPARIPRKATMPRTRNSPKNVVAAVVNIPPKTKSGEIQAKANPKAGAKKVALRKK